MEKHQEKQSLSLLTQEEINNPHLVVAELFDFAHLPELKKMLWEWLKATVSGSYTKTFNSRERSSILILYEYMQKMIEANHLLYTEQKKLDEKKSDQQKHIF